MSNKNNGNTNTVHKILLEVKINLLDVSNQPNRWWILGGELMRSVVCIDISEAFEMFVQNS